MSYKQARKILSLQSSGLKQRPWDVLNASITIKEARKLVPCPRCKIHKVMQYQADEGTLCHSCTIKR